jgi:propane monooxygenase reductase subunit
MGRTHTVRFEPVDLEMEVDEDETILDAAFRQGIMLMHGCREGQCSACKSFVLEGEVDMDKYSTFALPDFEEAEGFTLLCKAHAVSDLEIELINFDEDALRNALPLVTSEAAIEEIERLTPDIFRLVLKLPDDKLRFHPGQYVDIQMPDPAVKHRSFSMSNTPQEGGRLEFMIKAYPDAYFAGMLDRGSRPDGTSNGDAGKPVLGAGDALTVVGPYGAFTLRDSPRRLVYIGGGAGMAPIYSLLTSMAEEGSEREAVFYYGARTEADLFHVAQIEALAGQLPNFTFVPVLSHCPDDDTSWTGERGLVTDVVDRLEGELAQVDAYLCGPPPMVDAALALLERHDVPSTQIFFDKFTTTTD